MLTDSQFLLGLVSLTSSYWLVDKAIRGNSLHRYVFQHFGHSDTLMFLGPLILGAAFAPIVSWSMVPDAFVVRSLCLMIGFLLTWKAATKDFDIVSSNNLYGPRISLFIAACCVSLSPSFIFALCLILTKPFRLWQHHATLPMRILQAISAWVLFQVSAFPVQLSGSGLLWWFLVVMLISHYFMTAGAKIWLGPKWYSWPLENKIHHLAASAYSWGWAKFIPWSKWLRVINTVKAIEKPLQISAFLIELLAPLALLSPEIAIMFCTGWICFHFGVFTLSGLLFWDWMGANLAVVIGLLLIPSEALTFYFGWDSVLLGVLFLIVFPLRHKLWKPMPLGWWDTPLTQRVHWYVRGRSGKVYALTNAFMCPHERLFGKVNGCFLVPKPVFTYHLGEVWKHEIRDAIRSSGPNQKALDSIRSKFGILPRDETLTHNHIKYLQKFFAELNQERRKSIFPEVLRLMKAPGGQIFYWHELPVYRRQEPVDLVSLKYREEYFDGERLVRLCDDEIISFEIPEDSSAIEPVMAPSPKDIDDFLLGYAQGRLIELPKFGDGLVQGDDGNTLDVNC